MVTSLPTMETERLVLRPFVLADAPRVQELAGDYSVAVTTLNIPPPYPDGAAEGWIRTHADRAAEGAGYTLAVTLREGGTLVGAIGLVVNQEHQRAEMGYWVGRPYWGQGYATEAAAALLRFGFDDLGMNRIFARYMTGNPASGRVMEKIGMRHEGTFRQHERKWGEFHDVAYRGILREEFCARNDVRKSVLTNEAFDAFVDALDEPASPNDALRRLMAGEE